MLTKNMMQTPEEIHEERQRLMDKYGQLYDNILAVLFHHDPMNINFEFNTDEYDPEVSTILPRLHTCTCASDVHKVVDEEFDRWFSNSGSSKEYTAIASDIWILWEQFLCDAPQTHHRKKKSNNSPK